MNKFDEDINKRLTDTEVEPPHHIWSSIEETLDKKPVRSYWWRYPAAAAATVLIMISSSLLWFPSIFNSGTQQIVHDISPIQNSDQDIYSQQNNSRDLTDQANSATLPATQASRASDPSAFDRITISHLPETMKSQDFPLLASIDISSDIIPLELIKTYIEQVRTPLLSRENSSAATKISISTNKAALHDFALAVVFAPQHAYRYQGSTFNAMHSLESEMLSFSGGLMVNYRINKRIEIQSGIVYNRLGQIVHDIASFSHPSMLPLYSNNGMPIAKHPQSLSTSLGGIVFTDQSLYFADVSSSRITTLKGSYDETVVNLLNKSGSNLIQRFEYLEMPVSIRYKFIDSYIDISAKAGVSVNYLLSGNVYLEGKSQTTPIGHSVGVRKINMSMMGGLAFSYPVTNRLRINLEPTASMFMLPMGPIRNLNNTTYPYTWSVLLGISHSF